MVNEANAIDTLFSGTSELRLMTHVVAGYPDLETTEELILTMAESGVDLIEIQIPFSDPLADGPTIATANRAALDQGVTPEDCFRLVKQLCTKVNIPLLFMTYANIAHRMGIETFVRRSREAGIDGLIIPDLPFDVSPDLLEASEKYDCHTIPVVSPGIRRERLKTILRRARGFIYTTLRIGVTGSRKSIDGKGLEFLETLRMFTHLPIAAGFGISSVQMVRQLENRVDAVVIGSHIINLYNRDGIPAVAGFIRSLV